MVQKPRIYQLLRQAGFINTKADAINLLKQDKVIINGLPVHNPDFQVNPKKESILVDGRPLQIIPKVYIMLNKPVGCITSRKRSHGKKNVMELINIERQVKNSLFPVGRLDYNTTGLLLITNDGDFAYKILNPNSKIEKEYLATTKEKISAELIPKLESGVIIPLNNTSYTTLPAKVKQLASNKISIAITEGKKRQVRLMLAAVGCKVISLHRLRIGELTCNIQEKGYRKLKEEEIKFFS